MIINIHYLKFNNMAGLKGEEKQSILFHSDEFAMQYDTFYLMIGLSPLFIILNTPSAAIPLLFLRLSSDVIKNALPMQSQQMCHIYGPFGIPHVLGSCV